MDATTLVPATVARLRARFASGVTRDLAWRRAQLLALAELTVRHGAELEAALAADLGKPASEARIAEVAHVRGEARSALSSLTRWTRPRRVSTPLALWPASSRVVPQPLGVVLVIAPWNYPFELVGAPLVGAIAAGNACVVKPSELAPATSHLVAELFAKYLDPDGVAVVEGGVEASTALLAERFDHIFFTGGGTVGRVVMEAAAKHLTPVTLELGGKSPCVVDASADLDVAAKRIAWGKFYNAGQTCVAPDYVLAHAHVANALVERLASAVREFYGDDPRASPDYARIVNTRHHQRLVALLASGTAVVGGQHDVAERYLAPTVLTGVSPDSPAMADEIFGPILPVLSVESLDDAVRFVNARPRPLALYVFGNGRAARDVLDRTSSGGAAVNHVWMHLANPALPFGGVGASGFGAYHGVHTFEAFSHRRSVLHATTWLDPPLVYPPYTPWKTRLVEWLLG